MAELKNTSLLFKDKDGNYGKVSLFTSNDIAKLQLTRDHVAKIVDQSTGELIKATTSSLGVVQLASDDDLTSATVGRVVDAKQLAEVKAKLSTVYKYIGSVAKYSDLPKSGVLNGDVYNVVAANGTTPAGTNYAAIVDSTGKITWDALGGALDTSNYATKTGNNSFTGTNTFTGINTVPNITDSSADGQIVNKKYVDDIANSLTLLMPDVVKYSASEPTDVTALVGNSITFYPSSDLLV